MKRFRIFLAPLALLLTGAAAESEDIVVSGVKPPLIQVQPPLTSWRMPAWHQVRIEQRFSIRIIPGTASMPPSVVAELEEEERVERVEARKIGKCLGINSIAAVQVGDSNELLLFLRDQRIVRATLEKRCSARDFYSGFYVTRNADGAICAGRDILQSRSGANCKLKRFNQLVSTGYRRFP